MGSGINSFEDLMVWQKVHQFVLAVYKATECFPKTENYGLTSQFRRASVSIPANIAEGYKRLRKAEKLRFYNISQASLEECRYFIILSRDLNYTDSETSITLKEQIVEVSRMLNAYAKSIFDSKKS
jgi:four helix bundle protein